MPFHMTHALVHEGRIVALGDVVTCEDDRATYPGHTEVIELETPITGHATGRKVSQDRTE